jgi:hypothetical protein
MLKSRAPRIAWCLCGALIITTANAAADGRYGRGTDASATAEEAAIDLVQAGSARLGSEAAPVPLHLLPDVTPRPNTGLHSLHASQERPRALMGLYLSFATLQALDAHSTLRAVNSGRPEANPVLAPFTDRPGMMLAMKATTTVTTVLLTEKLWRRNRTAAVILMVAVNAGYAAVVASNYGRER